MFVSVLVANEDVSPQVILVTESSVTNMTHTAHMVALVNAVVALQRAFSCKCLTTSFTREVVGRSS